MQCSRVFAVLFPLACFATSIPRISLEEAVAQSGIIVSGDVVRTWSSWDSGHRYIWTHAEISVRDRWKGTTGSTVTVSEPGGIVEGVGQSIAGMVRYVPGERVVVFLYRTPIGYLRTAGVTQGKLTVDAQDRVHTVQTEAEVVAAQGDSARGTPIRELESLTVSGVRDRISRIGGAGNAARQ